MSKRCSHHNENNSMVSITSKMTGDAGEYYAVSQFLFAGHPATKMPDLWTGYDLAVDLGTALQRMSVKTRNETDNWKAAAFFTFNDRDQFEWAVCIFVGKPAIKGQAGLLRSWIIPIADAKVHWSKPGVASKIPYSHDISWLKLNGPLLPYEDNWQMRSDLCQCAKSNSSSSRHSGPKA